jgi:hypothetical protein
VPENQPAQANEQIGSHLEEIANIKLERAKLSEKYGCVANKHRWQVDRFQITSTSFACAFLVVMVLSELVGAGILSITLGGIVIGLGSVSKENLLLMWVAPQMLAIVIGIVGLLALYFGGYSFRALGGGVAGAMWRWGKYVNGIHVPDPNCAASPMVNLLSLSMTARRLAAHTYFWGVVIGLLGLVSFLTVPLIAGFVDSTSSVLVLAITPVVLLLMWGLFVWRGHICQWMFLPVPELLRQYLMLLYSAHRSRTNEEAYLLADRKLNESVDICPECFIDLKGKISLVENT